MIASPFFTVEDETDFSLLRLRSEDGTNRLTRSCVLSLTETIRKLAEKRRPMVVAGNTRFFSVGADLREIAALDGTAAYEFSKMGQTLMRTLAEFPSPVYAAIAGYCMGGGLDLALACHRRIAAPHAVFGHRGDGMGWDATVATNRGQRNRFTNAGSGAQGWRTAGSGNRAGGCRG